MLRTLFFLFLPFSVLANDLPQIRKEYYAAVNNAKASEKLYDELRAKGSSDPLVMAYYGSAQALRARHAFNPYHKLAYLKSGFRTLESAVIKSPDNLEIRFLRFSLEHYIPSFLGYSKHLESDKKKIVELAKRKEFGTMDRALLLNMLSFLKETKRYSNQEIAILDHAIKNG